MGNKSFVSTMFVDVAKRRHGCQHSQRHIIVKGQIRLSVKEGREVKNYCLECAKKFIAKDIENLSTILGELERAKPPGAE